MIDMLAEGRKILASQAFSVLMKTEMTHYAPGEVEMKIPITDAIKQQYGFVHGGALGYAADNALTFAGASMLKALCVSSEYKINFLRPAIGDFLIVKASVIYAGKSQAVCRSDIYASQDGVKKHCATAQGTIVKMSQKAT